MINHMRFYKCDTLANPIHKEPYEFYYQQYHR